VGRVGIHRDESGRALLPLQAYLRTKRARDDSRATRGEVAIELEDDVIALGLCFAALVLSAVVLVQSKGENVIAWAVSLVAVSLLWGRF
jgi:uncharacterized protein (DUF934 family)